MLNKSLFICYSTPNYSKLTNLCIKSLNDINVTNIEHKLDNPTISFKNTGFQTDLWYYCIRNKLNHLIDILNNYDNLIDIQYFIFRDCDFIYIRKKAIPNKLKI